MNEVPVNIMPAIFLAIKNHHPLASTKLYCLVTEAEAYGSTTY